MDRGKMSAAGRGAKSKAPQHPQDIFALGSKSTVVVSRDSEKRNIHKPSTSSVERKRETSGFGSAPPSKRARIGSPAEAVGGTSLEVDPVDLVPNVLQALDTHNSDKLLGLLTGSIRLLKSQRAKPDPILCMSMLYLCKIRPNMFAHDTVTQTLCTLLKREQGAAFKNKGNPLVFVLACNMLYAGHRESNNWPDTFIKVYIEDALNERWWVECSWCKCLVENIVTAFSTKQPPQHLIPTESTLGTMSPSGSGSPLMGSTEDDTADTDLEYSVFPRYSSSYETVEALVLEAIKDQIQRRAAPDAIGKGFLKLLSATCGFPEIRMISASRLEAWLHSGKLWRCGLELLAHVCCNADACGPTAARDHDVLAQLARMRLKTKPLQQAYQACLREMVSESPALLRSVVTHTIYNELSTQRSPHNMAVLASLVQAQAQLVPTAMAETYLELVMRAEDYLRPLRALTRECVRGARADVAALLPLACALAAPPPADVPADIRERAFCTIADLFCVCCLVTASHCKHAPEHRQQLAGIQAAALGWMLDPAPRLYRPSRHLYQHQLNKIMFLEPAETYSKPDNWPPESERAYTYRLCCEAPLPHSTLLRIIYIGLSKETPVGPAEVLELLEAVVRRACGTDGEHSEHSEHDLAELVFQLTQFNPPDNITLPPGYSPPPLAITSLYWRAWLLLVMLCAHNSATFSTTYPTLTTLIDTCITGKPSVEWNAVETERVEAERAAILQLETHLAASSGNKLPISEHNSRLISQLTTLDPAGPARKPPAAVLEQLQQLNQQLKLGKLLCRQPALLLELVERHGTRRAMPWLHQLLTHDQLQLSVLPVQCLCEFLSAGADAARAAALAAHVRRVLHDTGQGAACVLAYYAARLAHHSPATRLTARTGLKLVLSTSDDAELDYNADVSPDEWMDLLWELRHWDAVRSTFVSHVRAACQLECVPRHVASYITLLDKYLSRTPDAPLADIALDLSQVLMERMTVMSSILPPAEMKPHLEPNPLQHKTLYSLTKIFYTYMQKVISEGVKEDEVVEGGADKVVVQWSSGKRALIHLVIAHANLKLMCCGPSIYDTDQEMYSYLVSLWVGSDQALVLTLDGSEEAELLPDWLRLHLVRSARPPLLDAGLRGLPAHKLALFIQTFGMPVASMSGLLRALDACPAGSIARVGVERGYMWQLLGVQRARGATGGAAFAAALRLQPDAAQPDENLFNEEPLPPEPEDMEVSAPGLQLEAVPQLLDSVFAPNRPYSADLDMAFTMLISKLTEEVISLIASSSSPCRFVDSTISFLQNVTTDAARAAGLLQHQVYSATLLRTLVPANIPRLKEISSALLQQYKCVSGPVLAALSALHDAKQEPQPQHLVPRNATKEQLITILESALPSNLESIGNRIIEMQEPQLVVDVIATILENNQDGKYDYKIKSEDGIEEPCHVFSQKALGCGLLLDWISELQREMVEPQQRLMRVMFVGGRRGWRALLVTLLAHRASPRALHRTLAHLLQPHGAWDPTAVLDFAETLTSSPRVWQGRDRTLPKHYQPDDTLRLSHQQLHVLIRYVCAEAALQAGSMEARLALVLRCCSTAPALLCAALAASDELLMLLYMKVPKIRQLVSQSGERPCPWAPRWAAAAAGGAACDRVAHTLLTALAANDHTKDHAHKARTEGAVRALWSRAGGLGARGVRLAAGVLRGAKLTAPRHVLAALEVLDDKHLFAPPNVDEIHNILECYVSMIKQQAGAQGGGRDSALAHRVAALLRRYVACKPNNAAPILQAIRECKHGLGALSSVSALESSAPASSCPPPHALHALERRVGDLPAAMQEIDSWATRRGGAWGGRAAAARLLAALAPLAARARHAERSHALALVHRLLPAVQDTAPGLNAVMECLDSPIPEVVQSMVDKIPDLVVGMPEHAHQILMKVFELGLQSRHPVEQCITKCVTIFNAQRGC